MSTRQRVLGACRTLGLFALARRLTSGGLRIFCYHGISLGDEHAFQPKLFMRADTFRSRMELLASQGYVVMTLDDALAALDQNRLPPFATVITFDDGWLGTGTQAAPILAQLGFSSTLYVTTHEVVEEVPVLSVALAYLLWRGRTGRIDLGTWFPDEPTHSLSSALQREQLAERLKLRLRNEARSGVLAALERIAGQVGVDWPLFERSSMMRLMTSSQLASLEEQGMSLELHTHTHRMPSDERAAVEDEIRKNRDVLVPIAKRELRHFCYPSGEYDPRHFEWLRALGIRSATTCKAGFTYRNTERMALPRFLDGQNISTVEFEAELSGFLEIMRRLRGLIASRAAPAH